jgi:hypothetical protein
MQNLVADFYFGVGATPTSSTVSGFWKQDKVGILRIISLYFPIPFMFHGNTSIYLVVRFPRFKIQNNFYSINLQLATLKIHRFPRIILL